VHAPGTMVIRYAGGLEPNMTRDSVLRVARVVEKLAKSGCPIRFEVNTRAFYYRSNLETFGVFKHTLFTSETRSTEDYRDWLMGADVSLIAYNFDEKTANYVRYSMANKMPECLASGSVLLAHGPAGYATIDHLAGTGGAVVVTEDSDAAVEQALRDLQAHPEKRAEIGAHGRATAFTRHNVFALRESLREIIARAATAQGPAVRTASSLLLMDLAADLLLEPSAALKRIETDAGLRDSIETALTGAYTPATLRTHFIRCRGHAMTMQKVSS